MALDRERCIEALTEAMQLKNNQKYLSVRMSFQFVEELIELLKEHEAVEPKKVPWLHSDGSESEKYRCGSCDLSIFPSYKYCPFCGKKVDWDA